MQLEIMKFIHNSHDWETLLTEAPYFIKIKRCDDYILLKYDQIRSDMTLSIVRECRGIILDEFSEYNPVCVPFFKFGNYGESYVPEIDWDTARFVEKLDGSLVKLWYHNEKWRVSSNGEIDARNANISSALLKDSIQTDIYTLFNEAWSKTKINFDELDKNYTYMFELTSPHNRIVVRYDETTIRHIGTRNINTLQECDMDIGIAKPRTFAFNTLENCIESAKNLGYNEEGYIVVDQHFNRIKVKSPLYVALNHISQGVTTYSNIVEIIQRNEQSEFLAYFPEFHEAFDKISSGIDTFTTKQDAYFTEINAMTFESRKSLAEIVTKTDCPACLFALIDKKAPSARNWLLSRPSAKVLSYIGIV